MIPITEERPTPVAQCPDCSDRDEDCEGIENKERCWMHAPGRGMCPFLRAGEQ